MKKQSIFVLVMAVLLFGSMPSAFGTTASFHSWAYGVSADGSTVVGASYPWAPMKHLSGMLPTVCKTSRMY